jgi:hypothetical protein
VLLRLLKRHGLPVAIQSDNGPPFVSVQARGGLGKLSVCPYGFSAKRTIRPLIFDLAKLGFGPMARSDAIADTECFSFLPQMEPLSAGRDDLTQGAARASSATVPSMRTLLIGLVLVFPVSALAHHVVSELSIEPVEPRSQVELGASAGTFSLGTAGELPGAHDARRAGALPVVVGVGERPCRPGGSVREPSRRTG